MIHNNTTCHSKMLTTQSQLQEGMELHGNHKGYRHTQPPGLYMEITVLVKYNGILWCVNSCLIYECTMVHMHTHVHIHGEDWLIRTHTISNDNTTWCKYYWTISLTQQADNLVTSMIYWAILSSVEVYRQYTLYTTTTTLPYMVVCDSCRICYRASKPCSWYY